MNINVGGRCSDFVGGIVDSGGRAWFSVLTAVVSICVANGRNVSGCKSSGTVVIRQRHAQSWRWLSSELSESIKLGEWRPEPSSLERGASSVKKVWGGT